MQIHREIDTKNLGGGVVYDNESVTMIFCDSAAYIHPVSTGVEATFVTHAMYSRGAENLSHFLFKNLKFREESADFVA